MLVCSVLSSGCPYRSLTTTVQCSHRKMIILTAAQFDSSPLQATFSIGSSGLFVEEELLSGVALNSCTASSKGRKSVSWRSVSGMLKAEELNQCLHIQESRPWKRLITQGSNTGNKPKFSLSAHEGDHAWMSSVWPGYKCGNKNPATMTAVALLCLPAEPWLVKELNSCRQEIHVRKACSGLNKFKARNIRLRHTSACHYVWPCWQSPSMTISASEGPYKHPAHVRLHDPVCLWEHPCSLSDLLSK